MEAKRPYNKGEIEGRFAARVVKSDDPGGCWEFVGYRFNGYGKFGISARKTVLAHRFAYKLWVGPIPDRHHLHHRCENRACVRPDHLEPVPAGTHSREHVRARGIVSNQYGVWAVARSDEERRARNREWMRKKRAR